MSVTIPDGVADVLRELAAKLGVAAEAVWEMMLRQQAIEAWTGLAAWCLGVTVAGLIFRWSLKSGLREGWDDEGVVVASVASGLALITGFGVMIEGLGGFVGHLVNPAYYALRAILGMIAR